MVILPTGCGNLIAVKTENGAPPPFFRVIEPESLPAQYESDSTKTVELKQTILRLHQVSGFDVEYAYWSDDWSISRGLDWLRRWNFGSHENKWNFGVQENKENDAGN